MMSSPNNEADRNMLREYVQREVTFSAGFRMSETLITQAQYRSVTGLNPSWFQGSLQILEGVDTDNLPVENVSWYNAVDFCNRLSTLAGLVPAYDINTNAKDPNNLNTNSGDPKYTIKLKPGTNGYRLPTEAQWEYACRAGTTTPFNTGPDITTDQANYNGTPYDPNTPAGLYRGRSTEVYDFDPNAWGLYDMHGNLYEWCWDWIYNDATEQGFAAPVGYINYYKIAPVPDIDPIGLTQGERRVERGGSWNHWASRIRSAWRERARPERKESDLGFRVVLPLEGEVWKQ